MGGVKGIVMLYIKGRHGLRILRFDWQAIWRQSNMDTPPLAGKKRNISDMSSNNLCVLLLITKNDYNTTEIIIDRKKMWFELDFNLAQVL